MATKKLQQITYGYSLDTEPGFAPDGKSIIFTSDRGGSPQIYQLDLQSEKLQRLTYQGDYNARASFTPDGNSIVMLTRDNGAFNIAMQDLASNQINILTQSSINKSPSVSPNGKMIVYATSKDGQGVLAEVSVDGRIKLILPAAEGDVQEPAWSPFLN